MSVSGNSLGSDDGVILFVLVAGFHHSHGPIIEFAHPPLPELPYRGSSRSIHKAETVGQKEAANELEDASSKIELPEEWAELPFLALPDGAHQESSALSAFHLPPVAGWEWASATTFGTACYCQTGTEGLASNVGITRNQVQKAIVVLSRLPLFGAVGDKISLITQVYFDKRDFANAELLKTFYSNLRELYPERSAEGSLLEPNAIASLISRFKQKTILLVKLLLLQTRTIFYSTSAELLCSVQYALISLVPGALENLGSSATASLAFQERELGLCGAADAALHEPDIPWDDWHGEVHRQVPLAMAGLPLELFGKGSLFLPYFALQQMHLLNEESTQAYMIGTTNSLFLQNTSIRPDAIVEVDDGTIAFKTETVSNEVCSTVADRRFMSELLKCVHKPKKGTSIKSTNEMETYLRCRFRDYILKFLATLHTNHEFPDRSGGRTSAADFHSPYVRAFRKSVVYGPWLEKVSVDFAKNVKGCHPGQVAIGSEVRQRIQTISDSIGERITDVFSILKERPSSAEERILEKNEHEESNQVASADSLIPGP